MTILPRSFLIALTALAASLVAGNQFSFGDEPHSGWERLPSSTVAAARMAFSPKLAEQFVEETQLGSVFLKDARVTGLVEVMLEAMTDAAREGSPAETFASMDLKADELLGMLAGEAGVAYIGDRTAEFNPCVALWLNPSDESAELMWDLINQLVEESVEKKEGTTMLDVNVAGAEAFWLHLELPLEAGSINTVMAKRDNHLAVAMMPEPIDEDAEDALVEFLAEQAGRLLAEELPSRDRFEFADGVTQSDRAGRDDSAIFDSAINGPLLRETIISRLEMVPEEEIQRVARLTGYEDIGWITFGVSYGDQLLHQTMRMDWPSPRTGLGQLLDLEQATYDPPKWIPATAHTASQIYIEPDKVFSLVEEVVREEYPATASAFEIAKGQVKALFQVDLLDLLAAMGPKVTSIVFPISSESVDAVIDSEAEDIQEPTAIIIELADQEIVEDFARKAIAFAPPGGIEETDEQGYFGVRVQGAPVQLGAAIGDGHLILGIGDNVLEQVLASLKNPPTGRDAFIGSDAYDTGKEMLSGKAGIRLDITDGNIQQQAAFEALETVVEQMQTFRSEFGEEDFALSVFEAVLMQMPSPEESDGSFGVFITEIYTDNAGLKFESVAELPPPN